MHQILAKGTISLHPMTREHEHALTTLAQEPSVWEYAPEPYENPHVFKTKWFDKALQQMENKERICFTVFNEDRIIGSSSYYDIDHENRKTNIGYTWLHPSAWGTKANLLSKLILLEHAFEILSLYRVGFCVDSLNTRSCRALEKFGFIREGTLRHHLVFPNRIRNSVFYSVIHTEWESTKMHLSQMIQA